MTNMAAMPYMVKTLKKIFFSRTNRPMTLKLSICHPVWEYYQGCTNYYSGLTLTHFTPRSNLVAKAFVCEKVKIIYCLETIAALGLKAA